MPPKNILFLNFTNSNDSSHLFLFVSVNDKNMSDLQLKNVDFSANGVKCEETVQIKVLVKNIPDQTLQGSVISEK